MASSFLCQNVGGVAFYLPHRFLVLEVACLKVHATTALLEPNQLQATRVRLVFYQHQGLHLPGSGVVQFKAREEEAYHFK